MHCNQAQDLLSARLDGELGPDELVLLNNHVQECAMCRTVAERMQQQHHELRRLYAPRREAAAAVAQNVLSRLPRVQPAEVNHRPAVPFGHPPSSRARRLTAVVLAIAVLVGLILTVPHLFQHGGTKHSQPQRATSEPKRPDATRPAASQVTVKVPTAAIGETVRTRAGEHRRVRLHDGSVLYLNQNTVVKIEGEREATLEKGEVYIEVSPRQPGTPQATFRVKTPQREVTALGTRFDVRASDRGTGVVVTQGKVQVAGLKPTLQAGQELLPGGDELGPTPRVSHLLDWARDLIAAESARLVPASRYGGGALVAVDPYGQATKLTLRRYHIDVHIEDGFARTTIDQTYFNADNWRMEGTFYFPLSADASLSRLAMYVDGRLMEGGMAERDFARNVYEQILYRQRDPALLEWIDGSTFKMRVFPLEPRQEKRLVLSYTQRLETLYDQTRYRFPAGNSLPRVRDWSFHALVKHGARTGWVCDSHSLNARTVGDDLILDGRAKNVRPDR
ncbi:MAG TPA: VIT domain-containing protein, partial [Gemmataceae bacterium]|nr:VIT domain-containing protein [Gemmataceae bacterium]